MSPRTLSFILALVCSWALTAQAQDYPLPPPPPPPPPPIDAAYLAPPPGAVIPVAQPQAVTVRFVPKRAGDEYFISTGEGAELVKVPCELRLLPGKLRLNVTGASTFSARLKVPAEATSTATLEHKSTGLMAMGIAGAIATVLGVMMLELPAKMLLTDALEAELNGTSVDVGRRMRTKLDPLDVTLETWTIVGGVVAGVGVVCTAVGFALMGKTRVVIVPDARSGAEGEPSLELVGLGIAPAAAGGATAGATFAF